MIAGRVSHLPLCLFVLGLLLRVSYALIAGRGALALSDDAKAYNDLAVNLVERHQFVTTIDPPNSLDVPYAQRPPLTPFVVAGVYFVFGAHLLGGQLLLACLSALSVLALYRLGKQLFSDEVGILAALLAALYPFFVFLAGIPLTENLAILLYTVLALLLTEDRSRHGSKHAIVTGCVLGLAALNRPQILGFFPLLVPLVFIRAGLQLAKGVRWLGVVLLCAGIILAPWMIRNRVVVGGWFPVSLQGGMALYMGNSPYTQTALSKLEAGARGWYDDPQLGSELVGLSPMEADHRAFHLGVTFISDHPDRSFIYSLQKVGVFFRAYAHPAARVSWYPVLALSLLGFFWTARRWRELLPLYLLILQTLLTAAIFTSMPRFRAPVEPLFLLMAALALHQLWEKRPKVGWLK